MARVTTDPRAARLLDPVGVTLEQALSGLGEGVDLHVEVGEVDGFYHLDAGRLVLSDALEGPGLHHPGEPDVQPPLDRWRRALASVLEGVALVELSRQVDAPVQADWVWLGWAIDRADACLPEVGLALPDLAVALATGDLGRHPRAGVAAIRAWRALEEDVGSWVHQLASGGVVVADDWLRLGAQVLSPRGRPAPLISVTTVPPADIPLQLTPWRWQPLEVPAHHRGGFVEVHGNGAVQQPWAEAAQPLRTLAASAAGGCELCPSPGGPVGAWELSSAQGFSQVYGVRGITFELLASGALEVVFGDAFVGPVAAIEVAEQVGTSGTATGRWRVAGPNALRFAGISTQALTMHGRDEAPLVMPDTGFGFEAMVRALQSSAWQWKILGRQLRLRGQMLGGTVELRLRRC